MSNSTSVSSSTLSFHILDPKAKEEQKKERRKIHALNTHNGMTFKPSKYMQVITHGELTLSNHSTSSLPPSTFPLSFKPLKNSLYCTHTTRRNKTIHGDQTRTLRKNQERMKSCKEGNEKNVLSIDYTQWNIIQQSIECRSRNISNCSQSTILSKSSCNIDKSSLICNDYSNPLTNHNCSSGNNYECTTHHQVHHQPPQIGFNSNPMTIMKVSPHFPLNNPHLSISEPNPPIIKPHHSLSTNISTRSTTTNNSERLPSIHHLIQTLPSHSSWRRIEKS